MQESEGTDSDNAMRVRGLVGSLLEVNPCADAARAHMEAASSAEEEEDRAVAMQQAMSILTSDTCEATPVEDIVGDVEVSNTRIEEEEGAVQDGIEQLMEEGQGQGSSFIESKYAVERMLRFLVVLAIYLFLVVLCTWVVVWVAMFIVSYFAMLLGMIGVYISATYVASGILWRELLLPPAMLACGFDLFHRILDPEIGRLQR